MSEGNDWIETRIRTSLEAHSSVTEAAANRLKDLLRGQITERQLRPKELAEIAKELIAYMSTPAKPNV